MRYATVQDMTDRFGEQEMIQLTDPELAQVQTARIELKLDDAHALADSHLSRVYRLPLTGCAAPDPDHPGQTLRVAPRQLTRIVCDLARYYLYDDLAPEAEVYRRYKQAVTELEGIAAGRVRLQCPLGEDPGRPTAVGPAAGDTWHVFARRTVTGDVERSYR